MRYLSPKHTLLNSRSGFTLIELLMVVTIMSAVAWMSLGVVNNNMDQVRFDDTKNRLETIKRAIIGDTSRTINGQSEIRGYVADMGELPLHLQALLQKNYCAGFPQINNKADCEAAATNAWVVQGGYCTNHTATNPTTCSSASPIGTWMAGYSYDSKYNLWTGWNGPYLTAKELRDYPKFRDGWGNENTTSANNFGWKVTSGTDFTIQSYGKDGVASTTGVSFYEADYPPSATSPYHPLITKNEYTNIITGEGATATAEDGKNGIIINFGTPEPCWGCWEGSAYGSTTNRKDCELVPTNRWRPKIGVGDPTICTGSSPPVIGVWLQATPQSEDICMRVAYRAAGIITTIDSAGNDINNSVDNTFTWDGSRQRLTFIFKDKQTLPMGILAYNLFEYDTATTPKCSETALFQVENNYWTPFTIVPKTSTTPLIWKLQ